MDQFTTNPSPTMTVAPHHNKARTVLFATGIFAGIVVFALIIYFQKNGQLKSPSETLQLLAETSQPVNTTPQEQELMMTKLQKVAPAPRTTENERIDILTSLQQ